MKQLLIEKNSPLSFRVSPLKEEIRSEIDRSGMMIVRNVPCTILNEKNANGRSYSTNEMRKAIEDNRTKGLYETRSLLCTADDHPETTYPKPTNSSHVVLGTNIVEADGKHILTNDWLILKTEQGRNLRGLIEAGCAIGTSIRGLGRQNESSGEIEEYEYLGTDVVGNPSAGTFAKFKGLSESVIVEAVSIEQAEIITENLQLKQNKSEGVKMFDLQEEIASFKLKHNNNINSEAISDLLKIEMKVIENGINTTMFESFKNSVLGKVVTVDQNGTAKLTSKEVKVEAAKDEDVVNKTERHFEAAEIIAKNLREQNDELLNEIKVLRKYKESSSKLIVELTDRVKKALEATNTREAKMDESEKEIVRSLKSAAVKLTKDLQKEAKEAILSLENRLEQTIQMGDLVSKYFFASKAINEALVARIKKQQQVKEEVVNSKVSRIVDKSTQPKNESRNSGWK